MMDELNKFKEAWNSSKPEGPVYTGQELKKIVRGRSNSEVSKIRRKLVTELITTLFLSLVIVGIVFVMKPEDTLYGLLLVVFLIGISAGLYYKILKMKTCSGEETKVFLKAFLKNLHALINQYTQRTIYMLPVAGFGGFLLGRSIAEGEEWTSFFTLGNSIILIVLVAAISLAGYYLQKRYFHWIYGKNIERLESFLVELEHMEEE